MGAPLCKTDRRRCAPPIFKVRGIQWGKNHKKEGVWGEKWDFTQNRGSFCDKILNKMFCLTEILMEICEKFCIYLNKLFVLFYFFNQKYEIIGWHL